MVKVQYTSTTYNPDYMSLGAAGMDLSVVTMDKVYGLVEFMDEYQEEAILHPGACLMVRTGVNLSIPHGYSGSLRLRSSVAKQGLIIPNAPGTIDSDYKGEVCVLLSNISKESVCIKRGNRVAQVVIQFTPQADLEKIDYQQMKKLSDSSIRGDGGFGSTGKNSKV